MGCMGWNGGVDRNREVLERILALLLALAGLAERAACLPVYVRLPVLAILGYGEAAARRFVVAMAFGAPARAVSSPADGHAERLAASFRALALVLAAMLAPARRRAWRLTGEARPRAAPPMPPRKPAGPDPPPLTGRAIAYEPRMLSPPRAVVACRKPWAIALRTKRRGRVRAVLATL